MLIKLFRSTFQYQVLDGISVAVQRFNHSLDVIVHTLDFKRGFVSILGTGAVRKQRVIDQSVEDLSNGFLQLGKSHLEGDATILVLAIPDWE